MTEVPAESSKRSNSAKIYINKLAAAERMFCAAMRMFLVEEDDLAIHVVATSAYNILRDLKKEDAGTVMRWIRSEKDYFRSQAI